MNTLQKPKRDPQVETNTLLDGHVVVFNEKTNWACTLTPLAGLVWEFCDGETSVDEIVERTQALSGVPPTASARGSIEQLLAELAEIGLTISDEQ